MPVACLCDIGPRAFDRDRRQECRPIDPKWIRQIGIRSVDPGEKRLVHEAGLEVFDMRYIDEMGMRHTMELALATIDANTHLHVSFDVDFLDADIAPGVGTTVKGGPTYREAQLCMEMIADTGALASLDVMELNPGARREKPHRRDRGRPDREPVREEHVDAAVAAAPLPRRRLSGRRGGARPAGAPDLRAPPRRVGGNVRTGAGRP